MVDTPRKTFPELQALSAPVVDSDLLAVYRSPGPAKRTTASVLGAYVNTVIGTAFTRTLLDDADAATARTTLAAVGTAELAASTGAGLVGFIQTGTGAVATTAQLKMRERFSPEDFGAVGDGSTDDAPEFQLAINAINAIGGGVLVLTPGKNYYLNQQINLCDDLCVWGYGAQITVGTGFAGLLKPLFKNFSGTGFNSTVSVLASRNLSFYGIEFIGGTTGIPASLIPDADMRGVMICIGGWDAGSGADNVIVRDCNMHDFAGDGVMLWHCTNVDVSNNVFKNFFANVTLSVGCGIDFHKVVGGTVNGNKIGHTSSGLSWHGMVLLDWVGPSENLLVMGNIITDMNGGDGISCEGNGGAGSNARNFVISDNIILDCAGQGISIDFCISVKCNDNIIRRVIGPAILASPCIDFEACRNTIEDSGFGGIVSRYGTSFALITDNDISNIDYYDANYLGHGITVIDAPLTAGKHFLISGNRIKDVDGCGVFAYAASGSINNNLVYNAGRSATNDNTFRAGIRSNVGVSVSDNDIISSGTTQYGIASGAGDLFNLSGNNFSGTFGIAWYHIGYRGTGVNLNLSLNLQDLVYDATANIMTGRYAGQPAGYFYRGDTFYETLPASAGYIGNVVVATGTTWKTFGLIS
jgi:hypothetical protein